MRSLLVLLAASHCAFVAAADCGATSGAQTAAFVELYTSEGCSSWPPAKHLTLAVVPLQNGLSTRVTAGENKGEQLANDYYVVRDMASVKVAKPEASLEFEFKARPGWKRSPHPAGSRPRRSRGRTAQCVKRVRSPGQHAHP
jgi:hypothetical protein